MRWFLCALFVLFGAVAQVAPVSHAGGPPGAPPTILGPAISPGDTSFSPAFVPAAFTTTCASAKTAMNTPEQTMLSLTNQLRAQNGLGTLALSTADERSADTHSLQMAASGTFAHDSYGNTLARTQSCGSAAQSIAENIAGNGSGDPQATFQQYVNSPEHLANLLAPSMRYVGISFEEGVYNDGTTVWNNFWMNTMTFSDQDGGGGGQPTPSPTPVPTATLVATLGGPHTAQVGQAVTFTVGGSGAVTPYEAIVWGDGQSANWQQNSQFSHTYQSPGAFTVQGYYGDGATGAVSPPAPSTITVSSAAPSPSPTPSPSGATCAVTRNGVSLSIFACP